MEKHDIEANLNDIERDLADIVRRAHIAATNLREIVGRGGLQEFATMSLAQYSDNIENVEGYARLTQKALANTRELIRAGEVPSAKCIVPGASAALSTKHQALSTKSAPLPARHRTRGKCPVRQTHQAPSTKH